MGEDERPTVKEPVGKAKYCSCILKSGCNTEKFRTMEDVHCAFARTPPTLVSATNRVCGRNSPIAHSIHASESVPQVNG